MDQPISPALFYGGLLLGASLLVVGAVLKRPGESIIMWFVRVRTDSFSLAQVCFVSGVGLIAVSVGWQLSGKTLPGTGRKLARVPIGYQRATVSRWESGGVLIVEISPDDHRRLLVAAAKRPAAQRISIELAPAGSTLFVRIGEKSRYSADVRIARIKLADGTSLARAIRTHRRSR